jgi:hypothetical protein
MKWTARTVAAVVGTVALSGYAIWAQESTPPRFPAREVIELQATWNDGRYGVKFTFMASLLTVAAIVGLAVLPAAVVGRLIKARAARAAAPPAPAGAGWQTLIRRPAALSYVGAVVGLAIGLPFLWCLSTSPEKLVPAGGPGGVVGIVLLMLGPLAALAGELFAAEAIIGPSAVDGAIEELDVEHVGNRTTYWVYLGGKRFSVPAAVFARLRDARGCIVRHAGGTRRVLELQALFEEP